jgi:hypothetical protein
LEYDLECVGKSGAWVFRTSRTCTEDKFNPMLTSLFRHRGVCCVSSLTQAPRFSRYGYRKDDLLTTRCRTNFFTRPESPLILLWPSWKREGLAAELPLDSLILLGDLSWARHWRQHSTVTMTCISCTCRSCESLLLHPDWPGLGR